VDLFYNAVLAGGKTGEPGKVREKGRGREDKGVRKRCIAAPNTHAAVAAYAHSFDCTDGKCERVYCDFHVSFASYVVMLQQNENLGHRQRKKLCSLTFVLQFMMAKYHEKMTVFSALLKLIL